MYTYLGWVHVAVERTVSGSALVIEDAREQALLPVEVGLGARAGAPQERVVVLAPLIHMGRAYFGAYVGSPK